MTRYPVIVSPDDVVTDEREGNAEEKDHSGLELAQTSILEDQERLVFSVVF